MIIVEFDSPGAETLSRLRAILDHLRAATPDGQTEVDLSEDDALLDLFSAEDLGRFWDPTPAEAAAFSRLPVEQQAAAFAERPWDWATTVSEIGYGEYTLGPLTTEGARSQLTLDPQAYPFGGTGPVCSLLAGLGMTRIGIVR